MAKGHELTNRERAMRLAQDENNVQYVYGWKGLPLGDSKTFFKWVHVPDEAHSNVYEPWLGDDNRYEGAVHENVSETSVETIVRRDGRLLDKHLFTTHHCLDCGASS